MRTTIINTNWEYKASNGVIVNIKDHKVLRSLIISALKEGDDGVSAWCLLDQGRLCYYASEKLKKEIQGENYDDYEMWSELEVEAQNNEIYAIAYN